MERRWGSPDAATAAVRHAVRTALADLAPGDIVLAACSGGADSLALAAALAVEAPSANLRAGAVVVDHGLQHDSAVVAADAAERLRGLGLEPVEVVTVEVATGSDGLEAAARSARYTALEAAADARHCSRETPSSGRRYRPRVSGIPASDRAPEPRARPSRCSSA